MENLWNELKQKFAKHCQENGFKSVILGLSGGLDSAIVAVLAADVLGGENVTAIMMRSKYTSPLSMAIAKEVALLNNLKYKELDIDYLINEEEKFLKNAFREELKQVVYENLQARARAKILMAWSNQFGSVVLSCSNRSEILTGYCTLYGDTCGAFMPIGSVYKTEIFELAKFRNSVNRVLPSEVIIRAPTAELSLNQKDEDSLPPYKELDDILKKYVDKKISKEELVKQGSDALLVEKTINLYQKSEFKRKQLPTIL